MRPPGFPVVELAAVLLFVILLGLSGFPKDIWLDAMT